VVLLVYTRHAVTAAGADYDIEALARSCRVGGRPETAWGLERNIRRGEVARTISLGLFVYAPSCASREAFEVRYMNQLGPSARAPQESVIIGRVPMSRAMR
jgi:hypothetical protein